VKSLINMVSKRYLDGSATKMAKRRRKKTSSSSVTFPRTRLSSAVLYDANKVHKTKFTSIGHFTLNNTTGFIGVSQSLNFFVQQDRVVYTLNGGVTTTLMGAVFQNASSFAYIYDQYRIDSVRVKIYYSANAEAPASSPSLPMLYAVMDYDDLFTLASTQAALSYGSCRVMQLGNSSGGQNGAQYYYWPKCMASGSVANSIPTGSTVIAQAIKSPWLNSADVVVPHLGMKTYYDPVTSSNQVIGTVTFVFEVYQSYRNVR